MLYIPTLSVLFIVYTYVFIIVVIFICSGYVTGYPAYVAPDVMYGGVSSTDFTFCHCTVFCGLFWEVYL